MKPPHYKRILLKISGEALAGEKKYGVDAEVLASVAVQLKTVCDLGVQTAVVVGGGNIFRGMSAKEAGIERVTGDYIGMLATVMNALALQDACEKIGLITRVQMAIEMKSIAEPYIRRKAVRHLEKGRLVIFAGGTGSPYFTTDTTAALRANEIGSDVLIKATKVDGVYDSDPVKNASAKRYEEISFMDTIQKRLKVMDSTALSLCMDNNLPIIVCNLSTPDVLTNLVSGDKFTGTIIRN